MKKFSFGFSYIELIVTLAILSLIISVASPVFETIKKRERETELKVNLRQIRNAIDAYKLAYDAGRILNVEKDSGYPKSLNDLVVGVPNELSPNKEPIYFLRKIPPDPMYQGKKVNPEDTWGKRSYDSSAEDPHEGQDVFDVYSMSREKGLNGTSYSLW